MPDPAKDPMSSNEMFQRSRCEWFLQNHPHVKLEVNGPEVPPLSDETEFPPLIPSCKATSRKSSCRFQLDKGCIEKGCNMKPGCNLHLNSRGGYIQSCTPRGSNEKNVSLKRQSSSKKLPGSKSGREVKVMANHFPVSILEDHVVIIHFHVTVQPPCDSEEVSRKLKSLLQEEFFQQLIAFDGRQSMYIAENTKLKCREFERKIVQFDVCPWNDGRTYRMTLRKIHEVNVQGLLEYLSGVTEKVPSAYVTALEIATKDSTSWVHSAVNKLFYVYNDRMASGDLALNLHNRIINERGSICVLPGFSYSLRPLECGLTLNLDVSAAAFHARKCVIHYLKGREIEPQRLLFVHDEFQLAGNILRGLYVDVTYGSASFRCKIRGFSDNSVNNCMLFDKSRGRERSVLDYFQFEYYPIQIDPYLPCLIVTGGMESCDQYESLGVPRFCRYLPMEVCSIAKGQKYSGDIPDNHSALLRIETEERYKKINSSFRHLRSLLMSENNEDGINFLVIQNKIIRPIDPFGLQLGNNMIQLNGRVLDSPALCQHMEVTPSKGTRRMPEVCKSGSVLSFEHFGVIGFMSSQMDIGGIKHMVNNILNHCQTMGIQCFDKLGEQRNCEILDSSLLEDSQRLLDSLNSTKHGRFKRVKFVLCIFEANRRLKSYCYRNLKYLCETRLGWVTQCCLTKNFENNPKSWAFVTNIAFKINAKLGGTNTALDFRQLFWNIFKDQPVIIFGANVTHLSPDQRQRQHANGKVAEADDGDEETEADTAGLQSRQIRKEKMRKSCVAVVVASMNWPNPSQYCARVVSQVENIGTKVDLGEMVVELVDAYIQKNGGKKPTRAVFFRDGVSAGEFEKLINTECKEMNEALRSKCPGVKVTWLISQRSHHTRFFRKDEAGKIRNVEDGTVVDSDIVQRSQFFDFYLASHTTSSGTLKATHYSVLDDENDFSADEIERFVFNLCRTSVRCGRTVAVVPPLLYAHLAASNARSRYARTSDITDVPPTSEVIDTMYFC